MDDSRTLFHLSFCRLKYGLLQFTLNVTISSKSTLICSFRHFICMDDMFFNNVNVTFSCLPFVVWFVVAT